MKFLLSALAVVVVFVSIIGITFHNIRNHTSPNDIKSFIISSYNGSQSPETQYSRTLTLSPNSCSHVVSSPSDNNFATTTTCPMNPSIWNNITNSYFTSNLPTQSPSQVSPITGPIILLGVYYNDGTSNTVYFVNPLPPTVQSFIETIKSNEPITNSL
jgi:hypothetical protein